MEDRLRECPGCGGTAKKFDWYDKWVGSFMYSVVCQDCRFKIEYAAACPVKAWNTRATDPLLEKMAGALELVRSHGLNAVSVPTGESVADVVDKVLREYQERKDAK